AAPPSPARSPPPTHSPSAPQTTLAAAIPLRTAPSPVKSTASPKANVLPARRSCPGLPPSPLPIPLPISASAPTPLPSAATRTPLLLRLHEIPPAQAEPSGPPSRSTSAAAPSIEPAPTEPYTPATSSADDLAAPPAAPHSPPRSPRSPRSPPD